MLLLGSARAVEPSAPLLHVPSPDWRDQIVYFLLTDRFADGDPKNNDQGRGEYDPKDRNLYSGGDLEGIREKLDYIKGLGATAVWLTPPVANVWYDPVLKMAGYHGYWAEDFKKVDAHMGTLEDYRKLSSALHRRGMYLIQDVVVNHTGDFFHYDGAYDPARPEQGFRRKAGMVPPLPSQAPFDRNDAHKAADREAAVYHWTPDISDYKDERQRLTYQMSGLDDLNTSAPQVRSALRDSYDHWIKEAGVDGLRFDTAHFVEHDFWRDFIHSTDTAAPGVKVCAEKFGRKDFLTFGEVWVNSAPFSDEGERVAAGYLGTQESPEMRSALNFPLAQDLRAVFAKGAAPAQLIYRLGSLNRHFQGGRAAVNFVDNHDMSRFLSEGSQPALVQALTALLTVPGLPAIYAGTEQGLRETRPAMFAAGWGSEGKDHFDMNNPLYRVIRQLAGLRRRHAAFRRGKLVPLYGASVSAGPLAYRLDDGHEQALVLFNTADEESLLAGLDTGIREGTLMDVRFARGFTTRSLQIALGGRLTLRMPARGVLVLLSTGKTSPVAAPKGKISITDFPNRDSLTRAVEVSGASDGVKEVSLVIDGLGVRRAGKTTLCQSLD